MTIHNLAGYKFIILDDLSLLRSKFLEKLHTLQIKGTILLSEEGININLAGEADNIKDFEFYLRQDKRFADIIFHRSFSETIPFKLLKVKIKKEIITMRQPTVNAVASRAPTISPQALAKWLDENRDVVLLDTRNEFEVQMGTFTNAVNLHLKDFGEFSEKVEELAKDKPIVMFCTGGIRCEKAAMFMQQQGFEDVYQLDGGILGYFAQVGSKHYDGTCFVFDNRIAIDPSSLCSSGQSQFGHQEKSRDERSTA